MEIGNENPLLIAKGGQLNGKRWSLDSSKVIGRDLQSDIVIDDRQVSRYHARLTLTKDGMVLEDMGSKNGTYCNGEIISNPIFLRDGDLIQISLVQQFVYYISDATIPLADSLELGLRLRIDTRSHKIWILNQQLTPPLSAMQFQLLRILYERPGEVIRRQDLISWAWGEDQSAGVTDQALDALLRRLRDRLAGLDPEHDYIVTVRGHGIRLDNPDFIHAQ